MLKEKDIVFELGAYWAMKAKKVGYDIYTVGITHSTRCAHIGFDGDVGLQKMKAEIDRRIALDQAKADAAARPTCLA